MTAPRWEDVVIPLVRNERARLEEHLAWTRQLPVTTETARAFREHEGARIQARIAPLDAALARLAEPTTAAEQWRAVPADVRRIVLRWVERGQAQAHRDNVDAYHALVALAREAEGDGA